MLASICAVGDCKSCGIQHGMRLSDESDPSYACTALFIALEDVILVLMDGSLPAANRSSCTRTASSVACGCLSTEGRIGCLEEFSIRFCLGSHEFYFQLHYEILTYLSK